MQFTPEEEEDFAEMARSEGFYERFAKSVAPSIYGCLGLFSSCRISIYHSWYSDIKKAIACLLFGGSKKVLPDGMRLRGDINVLLLGDPGTAKSQLLKFVEKVGTRYRVPQLLINGVHRLLRSLYTRRARAQVQQV